MPASTASTKPSFSIALVNYKTPEVTAICLELLKKAINVAEVPVCVVDNNSNDESLSHLKSLDWIHLIERRAEGQEVGFMAHGYALDLALEQVKTDYLLLLHTDTLIYDAKIIDTLLEKISANNQIAAVGCLEQVNRPVFATIWRLLVRAIKYYSRKAKVALGIKTREPRLFYEVYLKSFCTLWNVNIIKRHGMRFAMGERIPGYEMQDRLPQLGYQFVAIPPRQMFTYLDHIEAGTVSMVSAFGQNHKRVKNYQAILKKVKSD